MNRAYRLGSSFPSEGFVQQAIERYFADGGYIAKGGGSADLDCANPATKDHWIIEAKGETSSTGLDFKTGLGQLLQRMHDDSATYAIAIPDTAKFKRQCSTVITTVRTSLNLHWLVVDGHGNVRSVPPNEEWI